MSVHRSWYTPGRAPDNPENEPFLEWLANVTSTSPLPGVISVSYGEDEKSLSLDYAQRINVEFQKVGFARSAHVRADRL